MLPPVPPTDIPDSERRIFVKLAGEPGTEDWIAFHSLGLSSSYTGHFGEIDFVIIIPGRGVVCVEVKGGGVSQRDGLWTSKDRFGVVHELKRSPFAQAKSAMFKLRKAVEERFGKSSNEVRIPFGYVVVLPDVDCPPSLPGVRPRRCHRPERPRQEYSEANQRLPLSDCCTDRPNKGTWSGPVQ
jgi:hypothetical protein